MDPNAPQRLAIQYARFIDGREFDRLAEIMTEDVQISSSGFSCNGLAAFREQLKILDEFHTTLHLVGNLWGEWEEGCYNGETCCIANHIYEKDGRDWKWEVGVRYHDRIIMRDRQALFTHREMELLWELDQPLLVPGGNYSGALGEAPS